MKNLFAAGCSFTAGHWPAGNPPAHCTRPANDFFTQEYKNYQITVRDHGVYAWPWLLQSEFNCVINAASAGGSMNRIFRNTLAFLDAVKYELDDWIFVIQSTIANRTEYIDSYNRHEWKKINFSQLFNNDDHFAAPPRSWDYLVQLVDPVKQAYHQLQLILSLTSILDNHNVKYVITGMSDTNYYPDVILQNFGDTLYKDNKTLANLINTENFILPTNHDSILGQNDDSLLHDPCGHPNKEGHEIIAKYILNELTNKGYM